MSVLFQILSGVLAQFWKPISLLLGGWLARGQREKIKDQKSEIQTHERINEADIPDDATDARRMLRERADKRNL